MFSEQNLFSLIKKGKNFQMVKKIAFFIELDLFAKVS